MDGIDGFGQPSRVHQTQILALQHQRPRLQIGQYAAALRGGQTLIRQILRVFRHAAVKKPRRAIFGVARQNIQFMIAQHTQHTVLLTRAHHPSQGRRRIGAAVNDVTNEHQATPLRMLTALVITQMTQ